MAVLYVRITPDSPSDLARDAASALAPKLSPSVFCSSIASRGTPYHFMLRLLMRRRWFAPLAPRNIAVFAHAAGAAPNLRYSTDAPPGLGAYGTNAP